MSNFSLTVQLDGLCFTLEGEYTPGEAPEFYDLNGDPGHPGTPPEIEIDPDTVVAFIGDKDTGEQIAVPGGPILDFAEKWDELEEEVSKLLDSSNYWERDPDEGRDDY